MVGGAGDDRLSGNRSGNRLAGGDTLRGGAGADVLSAAGLRLDPGFEEASALGGDRATTDDTLHGDDGDDLLTGSAGANVLVGGSGDDTLNGLGGTDLLVTADRSADDSAASARSGRFPASPPSSEAPTRFRTRRRSATEPPSGSRSAVQAMRQRAAGEGFGWSSVAARSAVRA